MLLKVKLDDLDYSFPVEGSFSWGEDEVLYDRERDLLRGTPIAAMGFGVYRALDPAENMAFQTACRQIVLDIFTEVGVVAPDFDLARYHHFVDDDLHQAVITRTRELRFKDFHLDAELIADRLSDKLGLALDPLVKALDRDHVQLRINRPNSLDINPPHRDAYLNCWQNVLNLWMPICGCDENSSLPVMPGSHLIAEKDIFRTDVGGAKINGLAYRVPAIAGTRQGLHMIRPNPASGELIAFTPFLIHGAAANLNVDTTRVALEFRLQIVDQKYPAN